MGKLSEETSARFRAALETDYDLHLVVRCLSVKPFLPQCAVQVQEFCEALEAVLRELNPCADFRVKYAHVYHARDRITVNYQTDRVYHNELTFCGNTAQDVVMDLLNSSWGVGLLLYTGIEPHTHYWIRSPRKLWRRYDRFRIGANSNVQFGHGDALEWFTNWLSRLRD